MLVEIVGYFDERIGGARHSREHNNVLAALNDQISYILNSFGGANRSSSKFQDLHLIENYIKFLQIINC